MTTHAHTHHRHHRRHQPSQQLARGITKAGVATEMADLLSADAQEVVEMVARSAALVVMAPPSDSQEARAALATVLSAIKPKQKVGRGQAAAALPGAGVRDARRRQVGRGFARAAGRWLSVAVCGVRAQVLIAESYGGRDEPVDSLVSAFVDAGVDPMMGALRVKDDPTEALYQVGGGAWVRVGGGCACGVWAAARASPHLGALPHLTPPPSSSRCPSAAV